MTEGYTRGPWSAVRNEHYWEIRSDHHGQIGDACASKYIHVGGKCLPESETEIIAAANARLMAASPDLLEALKATLEEIERVEADVEYKLPCGDKARAAIAKAEGSAE